MRTCTRACAHFCECTAAIDVAEVHQCHEVLARHTHLVHGIGDLLAAIIEHGLAMCPLPAFDGRIAMYVDMCVDLLPVAQRA